jgi:hypothetical protein
MVTHIGWDYKMLKLSILLTALVLGQQEESGVVHHEPRFDNALSQSINLVQRRSSKQLSLSLTEEAGKLKKGQWLVRAYFAKSVSSADIVEVIGVVGKGAEYASKPKLKSGSARGFYLRSKQTFPVALQYDKNGIRLNIKSPRHQLVLRYLQVIGSTEYEKALPGFTVNWNEKKVATVLHPGGNTILGGIPTKL